MKLIFTSDFQFPGKEGRFVYEVGSILSDGSNNETNESAEILENREAFEKELKDLDKDVFLESLKEGGIKYQVDFLRYLQGTETAVDLEGSNTWKETLDRFLSDTDEFIEESLSHLDKSALFTFVENYPKEARELFTNKTGENKYEFRFYDCEFMAKELLMYDLFDSDISYVKVGDSFGVRATFDDGRIGYKDLETGERLEIHEGTCVEIYEGEDEFLGQLSLLQKEQFNSVKSPTVAEEMLYKSERSEYMIIKGFLESVNLDLFRESGFDESLLRGMKGLLERAKNALSSSNRLENKGDELRGIMLDFVDASNRLDPQKYGLELAMLKDLQKGLSDNVNESLQVSNKVGETILKKIDGRFGEVIGTNVFSFFSSKDQGGLNYFVQSQGLDMTQKEELMKYMEEYSRTVVSTNFYSRIFNNLSEMEAMGVIINDADFKIFLERNASQLNRIGLGESLSRILSHGEGRAKLLSLINTEINNGYSNQSTNLGKVNSKLKDFISGVIKNGRYDSRLGYLGTVAYDFDSSFKSFKEDPSDFFKKVEIDANRSIESFNKEVAVGFTKKVLKIKGISANTLNRVEDLKQVLGEREMVTVGDKMILAEYFKRLVFSLQDDFERGDISEDEYKSIGSFVGRKVSELAGKNAIELKKVEVDIESVLGKEKTKSLLEYIDKMATGNEDPDFAKIISSFGEMDPSTVTKVLGLIVDRTHLKKQAFNIVEILQINGNIAGRLNLRKERKEFIDAPFRNLLSEIRAMDDPQAQEFMDMFISHNGAEPDFDIYSAKLETVKARFFSSIKSDNSFFDIDEASPALKGKLNQIKALFNSPKYSEISQKIAESRKFLEKDVLTNIYKKQEDSFQRMVTKTQKILSSPEEFGKFWEKVETYRHERLLAKSGVESAYPRDVNSPEVQAIIDNVSSSMAGMPESFDLTVEQDGSFSAQVEGGNKFQIDASTNPPKMKPFGVPDGPFSDTLKFDMIPANIPAIQIFSGLEDFAMVFNQERLQDGNNSMGKWKLDTFFQNLYPLRPTLDKNTIVGYKRAISEAGGFLNMLKIVEKNNPKISKDYPLLSSGGELLDQNAAYYRVAMQSHLMTRRVA